MTGWTWPWQRATAAPAPGIEPAAPLPLKIAPGVLHAARLRPTAAGDPWAIPQPPPGMLPKGKAGMAMDQDMAAMLGWAGSYGDPSGGGMGAASLGGDGTSFMGYPYLAQLTQRAEYRRPVEQIAKEMTRKWIRLTAAGDDDKSEKLAALDAAMKALNVQDAFRRMAELDGFFGKGQLYLDTGATDRPDELKTPLPADSKKIGKGALKRLVVVEPMWTYPANYTSSNPLDPNFYRPPSWFVMGKEIHGTRLLTFVAREMPDLLKPVYLFGGLSLSQMAKPYIDNWIRTRQSVSDLLHAFSVMVLSTNMGATLTGGPGAPMFDRAELFNNFRDNTGIMLLDKETEEFANVSAPLGTLDKLLAQSQEQCASVLGIPLVVLLGITPSGLNASTDGEIAVWQSWVEAQQVHLFEANLTRLIQIIQLSEFGAIDYDIGFAWEPLGKLDAVALAGVRKSDAEVAVSYIGAGVLSPEEERTRLAAAEDSLYPGLDVSDLPELPDLADPADDPAVEEEDTQAAA